MRKGMWIGLALGLAGATASALFAGMALRRDARPHPKGGRHPLKLLRTNALHTDLAIPATTEVRRRLAFLETVGIPVNDPLLTHILVGWGGEGFYPNNGQPHRIGPITLIQSVIGDDSVLRFAALAVPAGEWEGVETHGICDEALAALISFVEQTLERDEGGRFISLDHPGIVELDHFYEAQPTFAAPAGCNVWVSEALAEAGIPSGRWTPLPQTLSASIRFHRDPATTSG